jgi:phosphoribosylanthranilate isomerase
VTHHLRVKVCGVTGPDEARRVAELGADAVGLNFYPASPRYVDAARAAAILRELPPYVEAVGVFVNVPLREAVAALVPLPRVRCVQWHGEGCETPDGSGYHLIPAFPVRDEASLADVTRYLDRCREVGHLPAAVLLDAQVPGLYGGTGRTAPWRLLASFRPGVPVVLAGGLTPANVAEAVRLVRPYAVDVASGVESAPGVKDLDKVRAFIDRAREAASSP